MAFDLERATYNAHVDELRPFTGKWVLIRGTEIIGIYPSWEEVIEIVDATYKPGETCIMQIETVEYFSRDLIFADQDVQHQVA